MIALTRAVPPSITGCELTHISREPIDVDRAIAQHRRYEELLSELGCTVRRLAPAPGLPDSVFVEDTAVVLREVAVVTNPGAVSRRPECDSVAAALSEYRRLEFIRDPGTLDGGDVLIMGETIFVGRSARSNESGIAQLREIAEPLGYEVRPVAISGCLHLKTGVAAVGDRTVLINPAFVDASAFGQLERMAVDPAEPAAANALRIGEALIHPSEHHRTRRTLERSGFAVIPIDYDELARAEGGTTCCSILIE